MYLEITGTILILNSGKELGRDQGRKWKWVLRTRALVDSLVELAV